MFSASCDKTVKMWDLNSNQAIQVAQHEAPVKTVHFIKASNYTCLMTGSWDKTLKVCPYFSFVKHLLYMQCVYHLVIKLNLILI